MSASNQSNPQDEQLSKVLKIICEIAEKSASADYIYRGEPEHYSKVSSNLYREYVDKIEAEHFDIEIVQKEILDKAKQYTQETDVEILAEELQHYGGKTNLIDFTSDYNIALFFACDGSYNKNGRVILKKREAIEELVKRPRSPENRVIAQKSVFVQPPQGFIEPDDVICIQKDLKQPILTHLRKFHGISTETIYNDLHGFIKNQGIHQSAYTEFYAGLTCTNRGDHDKAICHYTRAIKLKWDYAEAYNNRGVAYGKKGKVDLAIEDFNSAIKLKPDYAGASVNRGIAYVKKGKVDLAIEDFNSAIKLKPDLSEASVNRGAAYVKKGKVDLAIEDFNSAIKLKPDYAEAYFGLGLAQLYLEEWDKARSDLTVAGDKGADIIALFHIVYESVADFEQKSGVNLPEDIAAMLTPKEAL